MCYLKLTDTSGLPGNPLYCTVTVCPGFGGVKGVNEPTLMPFGGQGTLAYGPEGPFTINDVPLPHAFAVFGP